MIHRKRILIGSSCAAGLLLLVAIAMFLVPPHIDPLAPEPPSEETPRPSQIATFPVPIVTESAPDSDSPTDALDSENAEPEAADIEASPEVIATRRMIAAHAPLREPSVSDPDSPENMAVLQNMLTQILAPPTHLTTSPDE